MLSVVDAACCVLEGLFVMVEFEPFDIEFWEEFEVDKAWACDGDCDEGGVEVVRLVEGGDEFFG